MIAEKSNEARVLRLWKMTRSKMFLRLREFYSNKKILVTGHTGFKGTWLCEILKYLGADVIGYSLEPLTNPNLYHLTGIEKQINSYISDIRDLPMLHSVFQKEQPEIVIHMAAQPIVRESYRNPVDTYATNVMGTVNVLECVRNIKSVKSVVNVTTDKVYRNNEWERGYVETDYLDGFDPYSNSKSCSELVTHSYIQSFLKEQGVAVSTCRAGNVIGGGDFAIDRIIPDCVRAAERGEAIIVRNPASIRPFQHVLEPLFAYLLIAMEQYDYPEAADCYNVGPDDTSCVTTGELVTSFCEIWNRDISTKEDNGNKLTWINQSDGGPHEANFLKLDCTKLKQTFGWKPQWTVNDALERVIVFEKLRLEKSDNVDVLNECMKKQIAEYMDNCNVYICGIVR